MWDGTSLLGVFTSEPKPLAEAHKGQAQKRGLICTLMMCCCRACFLSSFLGSDKIFNHTRSQSLAWAGLMDITERSLIEAQMVNKKGISVLSSEPQPYTYRLILENIAQEPMSA